MENYTKEATRPDPAVRPPSRYRTGVLDVLNGVFSCILWCQIQDFHMFHVVYGIFVIMLSSQAA